MKNEVASRIALVTGVGRREGIGYEVCRQLAGQPITVLLTARNSERARAFWQRSCKSKGWMYTRTRLTLLPQKV
jgi:NAD(P)-dependent dehydrogenase (short-subunit alcohol dehydrogenase family)